MKRKLLAFIKSETFRYLFFGVLAVAVNILSYKLLDLIMGRIWANTIAFILTVLFAYWTNSTFVFRVPHTWKNFIQFVSMRMGGILIDDGGMWLLLFVGVNDLVSKVIVNAVVIIINYVVSRFWIFKTKEPES